MPVTREAIMADRVSASITIGGTIDADTFAELAERIADELLSLEWDGLPFEAHQRTIGEPLRLHGLEVAWGRFDVLEAWCRDKGMPFVRWSGGYPGQFGAEQIVFRGSGQPETYAADDDEQVILGRQTVECLGSYAAIIAYFEAADFEPPALVVAGDPVPLPPTPDARRSGEVG
jgi:hypothetical protein